MGHAAVASWTTATADATEALGASFARRLPPLAAGPFVIELRGGLGAGKTTFARGVLRALGVRGPIKSPSYTLLEVYPADSVTALHLDLYRLADPAELEQLALRDYCLPQHLWLIEWPEKGAGHLPAADLALQFDAASHGHQIQAVAKSSAGLVMHNTA
ncbi:MAG: tRNA (adenosine(37)-N6)-threonylcarbamoyltransferase complex ATPase subunit type 1 TsaE [Steroidobacteraceae bacterium]|nr:tRNA (adenosine(37)-N6)-threonylcarbamoyltransferase complex ATPase subunit type 1 TsaE [Steroidobacteraceae bacterium]